MSDAVLADFSRQVTQHVTTTLAEAAPELRRAAEVVVRAGRAGRVVHTTGAGHSLAGVVETFFRAGGLSFVRPVWHPDLLPLNGALRSTEAERTPGLGREVVGAAGLTAGDVLVIFSSSGINHYPVEAALTASEAGATVIALTSRSASDQAPLRAGHRLHEIADVVLDTRVPPGDASWPTDAPRTAPLSSIVNAAMWDAVLVLVHELDPDLPLWLSANIAAPAGSNEEVADRYAAQVPELRAGLSVPPA
ncbi:sugar isomerase domain-containing protein [Georgenia faecalis]|uniref:Sugar isomerase domain-containing protein n=1 Tax=Georgenia faecalis TaxID=2483799 RepID=A0ABV9DCY5_9MICO|nr:sugar isomerase domain-containing protein [Georgenia faecalis]